MDRIFLLDAIKGAGIPLYGMGNEDFKKYRPLIEFTGNQHNLSWIFRRGSLDKFSEDELMELYRVLKENE